MNSSKKITFIACFVALFVILDNISIFIPGINLNITFRNLPIYVAGYLYGSIFGTIVAFIGIMIRQFSGKFAIDLTLIVWLLPQVVIGFLTGVFAKYKLLDFNKMDKIIIKNFVFMIILNLILTCFTTLATYVQNIYYGMNQQAVITSIVAGLPLRIFSSIATAIVLTLMMPYITNLIKNIK